MEESTGERPHPVTIGKPFRLVAMLRNTGKAVAEGSYTEAAYYERPPRVEDAAGKAVPVVKPPVSLGAWRVIPYALEPGDEMLLARPQVAFVPTEPAGPVSIPTIVAEPGRYKISFEGTGKIEVEVKATDGRP